MTRMGIFDADLRRLTLKDAEKDPGGRGTRITRIIGLTRMGIFDADLRRLMLKDAEKDPGGRGTVDADNYF